MKTETWVLNTPVMGNRVQADRSSDSSCVPGAAWERCIGIAGRIEMVSMSANLQGIPSARTCGSNTGTDRERGSTSYTPKTDDLRTVNHCNLY